jgi:hypothetical protein
VIALGGRECCAITYAPLQYSLPSFFPKTSATESDQNARFLSELHNEEYWSS